MQRKSLTIASQRLSARPRRDDRRCREPAQLARWLCLVVGVAVLAAGCARSGVADPTVRDVASSRATDGRCAISLRVVPPEAGGHVVVRYTVEAGTVPLPTPLVIRIPVQWAGRTGFYEAFGELAAANGDSGTPIPVEEVERGRFAIEHGGARTVRFRYTVTPRYRLLTEVSRFHALMDASRLYAPGHALLATFEDPTRYLHHDVALGLFPSEQVDERAEGTPRPAPPTEWTIRTTTDSSRLGHSMQTLVDAGFFAGEYRHGRSERSDRIVDVFAEPGVAIDASEMSRAVDRVVASQSELLGPGDTARSTVIVLRREDQTDVLNGSGREGGFVVELGPSVDAIDDDVLLLIAHESLHRLNGHRVRFSSEEEFATLWFREGITEFLAVQLAARHGVVSPEAFLERIGDALTHYLGNPRSDDIPAGELGARFWADTDLRRIPYDRGALLGLLIDMRLRDAAGKTLSGFLRYLRDDASARALPLTNAAIRDALARYSRLSWNEFWENWVLEAEPLPVFGRLQESGLRVVERLEPAAYYGFRAERAVDGGWRIAAVTPGSPAERAGVRTGDDLTAPPVMPPSPTGVAYLSAIRDEGSAVFRFRAALGQQRRFVVVPDDPASSDHLAALGLRNTERFDARRRTGR